MSYESYNEKSVRSLYLYERQLSYCIGLCSHLHNSSRRPAAHGRHFETGRWYIMEIKEPKLEKDTSETKVVYAYN